MDLDARITLAIIHKRFDPPNQLSDVLGIAASVGNGNLLQLGLLLKSFKHPITELLLGIDRYFDRAQLCSLLGGQMQHFLHHFVDGGRR